LCENIAPTRRNVLGGALSRILPVWQEGERPLGQKKRKVLVCPSPQREKNPDECIREDEGCPRYLPRSEGVFGEKGKGRISFRDSGEKMKK